MIKPKQKGLKAKTGDRTMTRMVGTIDQIDAFERFRTELLPALQMEVRKGTNPKEMRRKYIAHVQASQLMTALTDEDSAKRLAAQKDILDREEGKAVEKKEINHRLGALPAKELEALLISTIDDLPEDEEESGQEG